MTPSSSDRRAAPADPRDPWSAIPTGAVIGTASVRRQSQLLHQRPDLRIELLRGNVRTRLNKVKAGGGMDASLLAVAGLRRLGLDGEAALILDPSIMVPAAGQGIIGITVRADDVLMRDLLAAIEDPEARRRNRREGAPGCARWLVPYPDRQLRTAAG